MKNLDADSRVCWWLLLLFVLTAPFLPFSGIPIAWHAVTLMDWQRMFEAATLLVCMAWALTSAPSRFDVRSASLYAWLIALSLGLVSAIFSAEHLIFALLEWSWLLLLIVLTVTLRQWGIVDRTALDRLIAMAVLAGSAIYLGWFWYLNAFIYFPFISPPTSMEQLIRFPGFANIRYFSDYQSFMLLLLPTALYRFTDNRLPRVVGTALIGLYFSLALIVGSRSVIAAHAVLHVVLWGFLGRRYWPFLASQLRFWLYGALFFAFLTWVIPLLFAGAGGHPGLNDLARLDTTSRDKLWQLAWDLIQANPLLGVGPMHYANHPNPIASHPHNLILQFASEWGVPAALILTWLVGRFLFVRLTTLRELSSKELEGVSLAMTCATTALILQSMVAGTMNYPVSQMLALLCFAYPTAQSITSSEARKSINNYWLPAGGWVALVMVIATLTTLQSVRDRNWCFHYHPWPSQEFATRFWQQGWLIGPCSGGESLLSQSGVITRISPHASRPPAQTP